MGLCASASQQRYEQRVEVSSTSTDHSNPAHPLDKCLHDSAVLDLFAFDAETTLSADDRGFVSLFNWRTSKLNRIRAHKLPVQRLAISKDVSRQHFFTGSRDSTIKQWACQFDESSQPLQTLSGHEFVVTGLDTNPSNPHQLVSGSRDYRLLLWDVETGASSNIGVPIQQNVVTRIRWINSNEFIQASEDLALRRWDIRQPNPAQVIQVPLSLHLTSLTPCL